MREMISLVSNTHLMGSLNPYIKDTKDTIVPETPNIIQIHQITDTDMQCSPHWNIYQEEPYSNPKTSSSKVDDNIHLSKTNNANNLEQSYLYTAPFTQKTQLIKKNTIQTQRR
jgi:hypothetical protein